jgi:hypothetical protein
MSRPGTVTRAYQLALECPSIEAILSKLLREDYGDAHEHLQSPALRRELKAIIKQSAASVA